jgi:hypothetical protein
MAGITKKARKRKPPSKERFGRKQTPLRIAAAALLFAIIALLVWGAVWQLTPADPFRTPSFFAWVVNPEPHRAYRAMPVVPVGTSLAPRGLCAKLDVCGPLEFAAMVA